MLKHADHIGQDKKDAGEIRGKRGIALRLPELQSPLGADSESSALR